MTKAFRNDDSVLRARVAQVEAMRREKGLAGLVGGLAAVLVGVEEGRLKSAAADFLATTGYAFGESFADAEGEGCRLTLPGSADFVFRARLGSGPKGQVGAFAGEPLGPKSAHLPHTRVEAMVFHCRDLARYVEIQKARGVRFLTDAPVATRDGLFIQTAPSAYSALSFGFLQGGGAGLALAGAKPAGWILAKPALAHLGRIGVFDHASVRVRAKDRDDAIVEFLELTDYSFSMAVYVDNLNSITNVARLENEPYAMVITSGLGEVDGAAADEGPTEKFIRNYGRRIHHLAFRTEDVDATFAALKAQGMEFLLELVGSEGEGLKQTFSRPSAETLLVNEYIYRYPGFDGFFTKSNVTLLTEATARQ